MLKEVFSGFGQNRISCLPVIC